MNIKKLISQGIKCPKLLAVVAFLATVSLVAAVARHRARKRKQHDRVTIGLYSLHRDGSSFHPACLGQINKIYRIKKRLTEEAVKAGRTPPEFVLSLYLIPDWENNHNYRSKGYLKAKHDLFEKMSEQLLKADLEQVRLEDFHAKESLSEQERAYLNHLSARGSNADMIKTHAIICPENKLRKHLQLDSNTEINDYAELYRITFGQAGNGTDAFDAFNAIFYDEYYVSVHNKIVYTAPGSPFAIRLRAEHLQYCYQEKDAHIDIHNPEKRTKNSPYSKVFAKAASGIDLSTCIDVPRPDGQGGIKTKSIYAANMSNTEAFRLTKVVVPAVNMSWRDDAGHPDEDVLKKLPPVQVGDAFCGYTCFTAVVKKFIGKLKEHHYDPGNLYADDSQARTELLALSNQQIDRLIIRAFYNHVRDNNPIHLKAISDTFFNTGRGRNLVRSIFSLSLAELQQESAQLTDEARSQLVRTITP